MTERQVRFVREYAVDLCATQAAIRAGYSSRCARQIGSQLLRHPVVAGRIADVLAERAQDLRVDRDRVLSELRAIAYLDPRRIYRADGHQIPLGELPADVLPAIVGIACDGSYILGDKLRALGLLAAHAAAAVDTAAAAGVLIMGEGDA